MQKRGEVQKGFYITVLLVLGALIVASYFQSEQTGQSVYQFRENREIARQGLYNERGSIGKNALLQGPQGPQGPSQPDPKYPVEISCPGEKPCGSSGRISAMSDKFPKREEAEADATAKCDSATKTQIANVDKCIGDLTLSCLKKECKPTPTLTNSQSRCVIDWCQNEKPNPPGTNTHTVCYYQGKSILSKNCWTLQGSISADEWACYALDGQYYGNVKCDPLPRSTSSTSAPTSSSP